MCIQKVSYFKDNEEVDKCCVYSLMVNNGDCWII